MCVMICTINTDASWGHISKIGGWAFWIKYSTFSAKKFGVFKDKCTSPLEAEFKAIINALGFIENSKIKPTKVIINTDCLHLVNWINKKHKLKPFDNLKMNFATLIKSMGFRRGNQVEARHVKAHTHKNTTRNWVNDWCDIHAKQARKEFENSKL